MILGALISNKAYTTLLIVEEIQSAYERFLTVGKPP